MTQDRIDTYPTNLFETCPIDYSKFRSKQKSCPTNRNLHNRVLQKALNKFPEYSILKNYKTQLQNLKDCEIKKLLMEDKCHHSRFYVNHQSEDVFTEAVIRLYGIPKEDVSFFNRLHIFTDKSGDLGNCNEKEILENFTEIYKENNAIDYKDYINKEYDDFKEQKKEILEFIQEYKKAVSPF